MAWVRKATTVAVVGAGPSGLCAARHLAADGGAAAFRFRVFEMAPSVGGTWNYSEEVTWEAAGEVRPAHSSLYRNLRSDIPREAMQFPDFPMKAPGERESSYLHHTKVREYLQQYAHQHRLHEHIEFNKEVMSVAPLHAPGTDTDAPEPTFGPCWHLSVRDLKTGAFEECDFDAVIICNGHFSKPNIPVIPGMECFRGRSLHSRAYRGPEAFAGRRVAIWGCGPSAWDTAIEVSSVTTSVTLCHRATAWLPAGFPPSIRLGANIASAREDGFQLEDGSFCECDALLYCTGYRYSFPFLSPECGIEVKEGKHVAPLYKQIINAENPSMCFVGIPNATLPFPTAHQQVQFFLGVLRGAVELPPRTVMRAEAATNHCLAERLWDYLDDLRDSGLSPSAQDDAAPMSAYARAVAADSIQAMMRHVADFKKYRYAPVEDGEFVKVRAAE